MDQLLADIKSIANFSVEEISLFKSVLEVKIIPKGEYFLSEGQVCKHIAYIKSGLVMYFRNIDGKEIPCDFAIENKWITYLKSLSTGTPSDMNIKALEETILMSISVTKLTELFTKEPKFLSIKNHYTELAFIQSSQHANNLACLSAKDRYYSFMEEHPELIDRVAQYHIAAYLGIKPQSLSRIRK